jgi:hypothetical protein
VPRKADKLDFGSDALSRQFQAHSFVDDPEVPLGMRRLSDKVEINAQLISTETGAQPDPEGPAGRRYELLDDACLLRQ